MKRGIITIYDNYDLEKTYPDEDIIVIINDLRSDEDETEITSSDIWDERYTQDEFMWDDCKYDLRKFFDGNGPWIVFGNVGCWDRKYQAGDVFDTFDSFFYKVTKDCDYINLYDKDGHFYIECSHHDGTNFFEVKRMTDKGIQYLENWIGSDESDCRSKRYVHNQIIKRYSVLPRFAEKVYGA